MSVLGCFDIWLCLHEGMLNSGEMDSFKRPKPCSNELSRPQATTQGDAELGDTILPIFELMLPAQISYHSACQWLTGEGSIIGSNGYLSISWKMLRAV